MKNAISRFGKFLSGMVMPNIGAFIAWGFLTALFIEKGWFPNERLSSMVSPMLSYLLPILIAGQGGYMVAKERGRVIACIAVIGCICGSDYTMLMGAMVMGPLAGWVIKQFDNRVEEHIPAGFEMLVHNFSIGILGMLLAILGYYVIGPFMTAILTVLTAGVDFLVSHSLLPLVSIFIEPAKVLFLNNAINHGIFNPIGVSQAADQSRSRSGRSAGVLPVLQGQDHTSVRSRRGCHSPARRYPRDLLPVHSDESDHHSGSDRWQLLRDPVLHHDRCRSVRPGIPRFDHCLHGDGAA